MVQLAALAVNPPTFDPLRATLAGASLFGSNLQNATAALQLDTARQQHGALRDFAERGGFGNPTSLQSLIGQPTLFSPALQGFTQYQTWRNMQNALAAQRVLAAGAEESDARAQSWRQELAQALAEQRIDQNTYAQFLAQRPSDIVLQRLIDMARPIGSEMSLSEVLRMPMPGGGGQPPPGSGVQTPPPGAPRPPIDMETALRAYLMRGSAGLNITPQDVGGPPPIALPPQGGPPGGPRVHGWLGTAEAQTPPSGGQQGGPKGSPGNPYTQDEIDRLGIRLTPGDHFRRRDNGRLVRVDAAPGGGMSYVEIEEPERSARGGPPVSPAPPPQNGPPPGFSWSDVGAPLLQLRRDRDLSALDLAVGQGGGLPSAPPTAPPQSGPPPPAPPPGLQSVPGVTVGREVPTIGAPPVAFGGAPPPAPPVPSAPYAPGITVGPMGLAPPVGALSGVGSPQPPPSGPESIGQAIQRILSAPSVTDGQRVHFWTLMARASTRDDAMKLLREIDGGVERTAAEQARGKALGDAQAGLPAALQSGLSMIANIDSVISDPNIGWLTGWSGALLYPQERDPRSWTALANPLGWLPNSPGINDTLARISQIQGQAFMQAYQSLRGAGQISEQEGAKAQEAMTRLANLRQSDAGYMQALFDARREIWSLINVARQRAGLPPVPYQPHSSEQPPSTSGQPGGGDGFSIRRID